MCWTFSECTSCILWGSPWWSDVNCCIVNSLWSSPKFLNQFCLTILIRLRFSQLCASFSSTLFPSPQHSVNMLGYSTLWTASLFGNECLWLTQPFVDIYFKCCKSRAAKITKDSNHPGNRLFIFLPFGKSMIAKTERLRISFFPQAIRLLNLNSV